MKSEVYHCRYFDAENMKRKESCPKYKFCDSPVKIIETDCISRLLDCLGPHKECVDCEYYEE